MMSRRIIFALILSICCSALAESDWGFFFSHFADDEVERTTAVGPIVERRNGDDFYVHSVRPFVTHWENDTRDAEQYEVVWPLYEQEPFRQCWRNNSVSWEKRYCDNPSHWLLG